MGFRELLICLAITLLTGSLLFFYFKNRILKTEQKVDLMFQLIQEHERHTKLRQMGMPFVPPQHAPNQVQQDGGNTEEKTSNGLIQISDDEEDEENGYTDDSSEESDTDDENQLHISNDTHVDLGKNIKTISLSLSGAETNKNEVNLEDMQDLDEVGTLDDPDEENGENGENEDVVEGETEQLNVPEETKVEKIEEVDYNKMNMKKLKEEAARRGLENYKGLRKPKLVELLQSSST